MAVVIVNGWYANEEDFWIHVEVHAPDECWPWRGSRDKKTQYGHLAVRGEDGKRHFPKANRVAWELDNKRKLRSSMDALHTCDNPPCCNPRHLFEGTKKNNMQDMKLKRRAATGQRNGTHTQPDRRAVGNRNGSRTHPESLVRGDDHPRAKLTSEDVLMIVRWNKVGWSQDRIALRLNVNQSTVNSVLQGRTWSHVTGIKIKRPRGRPRKDSQ